MSEVEHSLESKPLRRLKPYPAYKDSGVEWLGEIPAHWTAKRLKFVAAEPIKNGIGEAGAYDDPEWPRYVRITDIAGPRELKEDTFKSLPPELAKEAPFNVGDVLLAAVGATFGKSYLHLRDCGPVCFAGYMVRFAPGPAVVPTFAAYWTESAAYWALVQSRVVQATIQNFSAAKYKELSIPLPPEREQRAIAAFLDRETARIDALVAKKERLIELLQEKRTALITRAVTKGLDPTVPMKDSGVEWLGEIPAHWRVFRFKLLFRDIYRYPTYYDIDYVPDGIAEVRGEALIDGYISTLPDQRYISSETNRRFARTILQEGDIVMSVRGTMGKVGLVRQEFVGANITANLLKLSPRLDIACGHYLSWLLRSDFFLAALDKQSPQTTIQTITMPQLASIILPVPSLAEQDTIEAFLNRETARIDALIAKIRDAIDRLRELRTALISAAVTGKIDVREEVV